MAAPLSLHGKGDYYKVVRRGTKAGYSIGNRSQPRRIILGSGSRYVKLIDVLGPVALDGHGELPVTRQSCGCGYELADDDVLLQACEPVHLALDSRVGQDAGRLLERGRREEAVGGERGLGYAHQNRVVGGRLAFLLLDAGV